MGAGSHVCAHVRLCAVVCGLLLWSRALARVSRGEGEKKRGSEGTETRSAEVGQVAQDYDLESGMWMFEATLHTRRMHGQSNDSSEMRLLQSIGQQNDTVLRQPETVGGGGGVEWEGRQSQEGSSGCSVCS